MNDQKMERKDIEIDPEQLMEENRALQREIERRDAEESARKAQLRAKEDLSREYEDFSQLFEKIGEVLCRNEALLDFAPMQRYRIGYLMLKGEQSLLEKGKEPDEGTVVAYVNRHPEILLRFVKGKKDTSVLPAFSMEKSVGIRSFSPKTPQNLTEARHAAIRYAKTR